MEKKKLKKAQETCNQIDDLRRQITDTDSSLFVPFRVQGRNDGTLAMLRFTEQKSHLKELAVAQFKDVDYDSEKKKPERCLKLYAKLEQANALEPLLGESCLFGVQAARERYRQIKDDEERAATTARDRRSVFGYPTAYHRDMLRLLKPVIPKIEALKRKHSANDPHAAQCEQAIADELDRHQRGMWPQSHSDMFVPSFVVVPGGSDKSRLYVGVYNSVRGALASIKARGRKEIALNATAAFCSIKSDSPSANITTSADDVRKFVEKWEKETGRVRGLGRQGKKKVA